MFDFEARVPIGWLANTLASQPIRTRASKLNIFVFVLRWPTFLTASTVVSHIYAYDRAKTLSFISLIRRKSTEFENKSNI